MKNGPVIKIGPGEEFPPDTPKQYLKGWVEFYKLKFKVTPDVLIPRPESELLVDEVIAHAKRSNHPEERSRDEGSWSDYPLTILDIGTGSGNIAISLAKNLPKAKIFATDISESALDVARENARKHRVDKKIFFIKGDLLDFFNPTNWTKSFRSDEKCPVESIITANLPYIPTSRIPFLDPSVKDFEPIIALNGGSDGFELYRKLFNQIRHKFLKKSHGSKLSNPGGWIRSNPRNIKLIVCEIDYTQGELAVLEAQKHFPDSSIEVQTDLAKKQRILVVKF